VTMHQLDAYLMPLIYLLLALQVADLATTLYVLRKGTGAEGNPVARKLMDFFGPELGLALPKLAFAGAIWTFRATTPAWAFALLCMMYLVIVGNNMKFVLRTSHELDQPNNDRSRRARLTSPVRCAEGISGPAGAACGQPDCQQMAPSLQPTTSAQLRHLRRPAAADHVQTDQDGNESSDTAPGNAAFIADKRGTTGRDRVAA
jgi:hypothetical protein